MAFEQGRYSGPGLPFGAEADTVLGPKPDVNVVITSIYNILSTPKGTVPYAPDLGSLIPMLLFEILDNSYVQMVQYYAIRDLTEQEPRIILGPVSAVQTSMYGVEVSVAFTLRGDPYKQVFSVPLNFSRSVV